MSTSFHHRPIVTDGLVFAVDAANTKSVPPSANTRSMQVDTSTNKVRSLSTDFNFQPSDDFTFTYWWQQGGPTNVNATQMFKGSVHSTDYSYRLKNRWIGGGSYRIGMSIQTDEGDTYVAESITTWTLGVWKFVTGYHNGTTKEIGVSLDGESYTTLSYTGTMKTFISDYFEIGTTTSGYIDSLTIFDKVLSTSERDDIYNSGSGLSYDNMSSSLKSSVISHYPFNETEGTRYDLHSTNDLTIVGDPLFQPGVVLESQWVLGQVVYDLKDRLVTGDATNGIDLPNNRFPYFEFDGTDDYIDFGEISFNANDGDLSTEGWFKTDSSLSQNLWGWTQGDIAPNGANYLIRIGGFGTLSINVVINGDGDAGGQSSNNVVEVGKWHHIVTTYNSSTLQSIVYLDDVEIINVTAVTPPINYVGSDFRISWPIIVFNGEISNVKIYNRVLTAQEVTQNYNATKGRFS